MASASKKESVNCNLRSVLLTEKAGIVLNRLQADYQTLLGHSLPFHEFGFQSLEAYLRSIPTVVSLQRGPTGQMVCRAVADETTKHIASLVSRQKGKKVRGAKSRPGQFNSHSTYPRSKPRPGAKVYPSRFAPKTFKYSQPFKPAGMHQTKTAKYSKPFRPTVRQQPSVPSYTQLPKSTAHQQPKPPSYTQPPKSTAPQQLMAIKHLYTKHPEPTANEEPKTVAKTHPIKPTETNQPKPGPWTGKLGSKRGQQPNKTTSGETSKVTPWKPADDWTSSKQNGKSSKPVQENIYITISNDGARKADKTVQNLRGKTKVGKARKPEGSSNFEVPPRFKKLASPSDSQMTFESSSDSNQSPFSSDGQPSPTATNTNVPEMASKTSDWIQMTLSEKTNGLWETALCDMHQKEFGLPLESAIVDKMSKLGLLQKESVCNCAILYPKLTVTVRDSSTNNRTVTHGGGNQTDTVADENGNHSQNGTTQRYRSAILEAPGTPNEPSEEGQTCSSPTLESPSTPNEPSEEGHSSSTSEAPATPSEPSEEGGTSPILEAPGMPSLILPEEDEWDLYVAYIKNLSDFYAILIGDEYSEQLIILEEKMRSFYQVSRWSLTEPPEVGVCYAAEFNREWLRVQVVSVDDDEKVQCFLLDHGDTESTDVSALRPLAENFLELPFQVIHCRLSQCEQVAEDDTTALQMFCQLALGKSLLAEVVSRDGDCIAMELFDDSDISILEQCMAAGI